MKSIWCSVAFALGASGAAKSRILLIPIDDRPATGQFAQMIGAIADVEVVLPPAKLLGRFTSAGDSDAVLRWLETQDPKQFEAAIVSTDMLTYGGLIASRESASTYEQAIQRIRRFQSWRRGAKDLRVFGFGALMRIAPTALERTRPWRDALAKLAVLRSKLEVEPTVELKTEIERLKTRIPAQSLSAYYAARRRNHLVQRELCRQVAAGVYDYMIFGQDDAQPFGPQVSETVKLRQMVANLSVSSRTYFCEGIDQHANVLVSRAITQAANWSPKVRIVYSDASQILAIPAYEQKGIYKSVEESIVASGGQVAKSGAPFDYSLYVNVPNASAENLSLFKGRLAQEVEQGFPVAVADTNLGKTGTGDPELFQFMLEQGRAQRLLGYAGWNTAGNTLGTTIPAASVYLTARQLDVDPAHREMARQTFLLHRLVNDFEFHRYTRPEAYRLRDLTEQGGAKEEVYGYAFDVINDFVRRDVTTRLQQTFQTYFRGNQFFAGSDRLEVSDLTDVDVNLPWPRAYEVRISFALKAEPAK
ncbi:MAG: DUF4127 family protein [Chthonomonas sp.]|nr:DUF4127 family protein [Chthonomonas sp.]